MADSDSDGPPPLAGDDSDSSGPPPLADSSSEEDRRPMQQEEESSEEDSEEDNFAQIFQAMQQRAGFGAGWRQALGANHQPLALGDRKSAAEEEREEKRKAEEERQRKQQEEDQRKREEAARKRAQLASLADAYRQAKSTEKKALEQKDVQKRMQEFEACCEECDELLSKVHVISVTEKDIAGEAKKTETLAIALKVDCYARWSLCDTPSGHNGHTPLELAEQANEACKQLAEANPATLGVGLKGRLNAIRARVHVAFGFAHLRLQNEDKAKEEARAAKKYELQSLGECKKLESLLHAEEKEIEERAKQDIGGESVKVCEWAGCGFQFPANATRKDRAAHRTQCEFRLDKCSKCSQTGIRHCDMDRHYAEACTARLEPCPKCEQMVRKDGLAKHLREECEERDVPCNLHADGCTWNGPLSLKEYHGEVCPYNMTQCQYCLEDMREWEMQQHRCPLADGSEDCVICCEQLFTKPVAMLMKTTGVKCSRTCDHFQMHVDCAMEWRSTSLRRKFAKGNSDQIMSECPHCNREYDLVNVLPEFLVVPPEKSDIRAPTLEVQAPAQKPALATVQKSKKNKKPEASAQAKVVPEPSPKPMVAKAKAQVQQTIPEKVVSPTFRGPSSAPKSKAPALPRPKAESPSASSSSAFQPNPRIPASNEVAKKPEVSLRPENFLGGSTVADEISCKEDPGILLEYAEAVIRMHGITPSWAELEHRRPAIPQSMRPNPQRYQDFSAFHLPPTDIHFCHDAVSETFGAFTDSNGRHQVNKEILATVSEMAEATLSGKRLPLEPIKVVWYTKDDRPRWTVAASFNRRLVVYRLLSIFMPDYFRQMKVVRVPLDSVRWYHTSGHLKGKPYHSTQCYGVYVEVGRWSGKYVGKDFEPRDEDEYGVQWPAAYTLFRGLKAKAITMGR